MAVFCSACNILEAATDALDGQWVCDGQATTALLADSVYGDDMDCQLAARIFDGMKITFDPEAQVIQMNIGNRRETLPYALRESDDGTFQIQAEDPLTIEKRLDGTILVFDPMEAQTRLVFKKQM